MQYFSVKYKVPMLQAVHVFWDKLNIDCKNPSESLVPNLHFATFPGISF